MTEAPFNETSYARLALQAEFLTDVEKLRIANENRIRALGELGAVKSHERGSAESIAHLLKQAEKIAEKDLRARLRELSFYPWITATVGLGDKQVGRLLGVIGHPRWRYDQEAEGWAPRTVGQLWSYCGYAVVNGIAPARQRGEQTPYNTAARARAFLVAESCIKHRNSPFRGDYDAGRKHYAESLHEQPCVRCGSSGQPAEAGSPLSDGHKHARALRLVAKSMLKELWIAAQ